MPPILAGLLTPDQRNCRVRRLFAGLGFVAALLALSVQTDPLALLLLGAAAVCLTGVALHGDCRPALTRFVAVNGVALLLLCCGAWEHSDLVIRRTPEQLEVTLGGVRLAANLAGIDSLLNHVTVGVSTVDDRPMAAPWVSDSLPWYEGFSDWLAGGMRGGVERLSVTDPANGLSLVPALSGIWQPSLPTEPPRLASGLDAWTVARSDDQAVTLVSPEIFTNRYEIVASMARPSAQVVVTLSGDPGQAALDIVAAPDRRTFAVMVRPPDGPAETLVGGPFVYRGTVLGWLLAIVRELGRVWLVAIGLVAGARLLAIPFAVSLPPLPRRLAWTMAGLAGAVLGVATFGLAALVSTYLLDRLPHTVESIAYLFQAEVIAAGGMWAPAPPIREFFEQAYVAATPDGRWFGVLPYGQSLLLAAGLQFDAPWIVSPIASGLAVALTVVLGRATYGLVAGVLAGLLLLFSPFVLMLSGDMLAHPAGLLLTVLMLLGVAITQRGPATWGWLLAGLAMGGMVLTRPLAAVGIGIPLTIVLVLTARNTTSRLLLTRAVIFALAATPGVFYAAFVNVNLTGSPFLPPLSLWSDLDRIGFGPNVGTRGGHDLASALANTWANLAVLLRHLYGWPGYLTLALAFVPFVLGSRSRWDGLMALVALGLTVAHWLYWSDGIIYGPRFEFEAVAALSLLTARGMMLLARGDGPSPAEAAEEPLTILDRRPVFTSRAVAEMPARAAVVAAPVPNGKATATIGAKAPAPNGETAETAGPTAPAPNGKTTETARATVPEVHGAAALPSHEDASTIDGDDAAERSVAGMPRAEEAEERAKEPQPVAGGSDEPEDVVLPVIRPGLSSVPAVVVLVLALFAIDLVGYLPELVLAYRDYNGISPAGLQAAQAGLQVNDEAGQQPTQQPALVFVSSDWPDWQSYGELFLANGPFLNGNVIFARDLGETENWRLEMRYPDSRWWLLKDGQLTEIRP
jgi:hypothetical protein